MLDIFFNNKIASTSDNWTDELILIASIFNQLDGMPYSRPDIEVAFETISTRLPDVRDASDYRDEYGAYGSFLGLVNYEASGNGWICRTPDLAKELLCGILPDPQAFIRLQMSLFQYPNPIGAAFKENGTLTIEHSSRDKRIQQVRSGVRTVPFRLLLRVLLALHDEGNYSQAYLTNSEIWHCLFANPDAINTFDPDGSMLANKVMQFRDRPSPLLIAKNAVRNLHILNHTGLVLRPKGSHILRLLPRQAILTLY